MTKVVHTKASPFDVYVGRPSKWGNPFVMGRDGDRIAVIMKYADWFCRQKHLLYYLDEIRDKTLACWCAPKACHGDFLAWIADGGEPSPEKFQEYLRTKPS